MLTSIPSRTSVTAAPLSHRSKPTETFDHPRVGCSIEPVQRPCSGTCVGGNMFSFDLNKPCCCGKQTIPHVCTLQAQIFLHLHTAGAEVFDVIQHTLCVTASPLEMFICC